MVIFANGRGMMKPSQLPSRQQLEHSMLMGMIGAEVSLASHSAPGPTLYRGPFGPSHPHRLPDFCLTWQQA